MQTAPDTQLIEFEGRILRIREATREPPRLLLLIHGLTGDENVMWVFARDLPAHYWMVAPRAPYPAEPSGFSWRPPPFETMDGPSLEQLKQSAEALISLVDAYAASARIEAGTFDVMGFSQGAAMCNMLAFLYPQRIGKAGILAGFIPSGLEELVSQRPLESKSFFVAHGTKDERVAVERARSSIKLLEQAGATVTYCEDDVAHKVSLNCLRALKEFFAE